MCLFVLTYRQIDDWKDDLSIWSHTMAVTGDNSVVEYHLALAYAAEGAREAVALEHYQKAYEFAPQDPYINLQLAWYEQGHRDFAGAIQHYQVALNGPSHEPRLIKSTYLGMASAYRGLEDSAKVKECEEAAQRIVIDPDTP
jgi:tetratricopeptide (TPR) repeat protein